MTGAAELTVEEERAAYRAEESALKGALVAKSRLYFGDGLLSLFAYPFAAFGPGWVRWIAGFLIAILLLGEFSMVGAFRRLQRFYSPFRSDTVLRNHFVLATIAIVALMYALLSCTVLLMFIRSYGRVFRSTGTAEDVER